LAALKKKPTSVIRVPVDCIAVVEKILGRKIDGQQNPSIAIRVPTSHVKKIYQAIRGKK
jgi:hypothetical protein